MTFLPQVLLQTPPSTRSLRDIKPPLDVSSNYLPYILLIGFIFAIFAGIAWLYLQKRRQTEVSFPVMKDVARPPHEIALEQLKTLDGASCDMEAYHTRISHVIRKYIAARYRIPALELTTTVLLQQLTREQISDLYVDRIQQFLANCDRVKFTKYQPERSEADARMVDARWFVEETKIPIP